MSPCSFVRSRQPCWRKIRSSVGIPNLRFHPLMGWGARARTSVATKARSRSFRAPIKKKKKKKESIESEIAFDSRLGSTSYRDIPLRYRGVSVRSIRERTHTHTHTHTYLHVHVHVLPPVVVKFHSMFPPHVALCANYIVDVYEWSINFWTTIKAFWFRGRSGSSKVFESRQRNHLRDVDTIERKIGFGYLILDYISIKC